MDGIRPVGLDGIIGPAYNFSVYILGLSPSFASKIKPYQVGGCVRRQKGSTVKVAKLRLKRRMAVPN